MAQTGTPSSLTQTLGKATRFLSTEGGVWGGSGGSPAPRFYPAFPQRRCFPCCERHSFLLKRAHGPLSSCTCQSTKHKPLMKRCQETPNGSSLLPAPSCSGWSHKLPVVATE